MNKFYQRVHGLDPVSKPLRGQVCTVRMYILCRMKQTATTATVEMCPEQEMGGGFHLLVGLAEIHVPRMWVEEDDKGHHVSVCV